jgi:hypothetical protein
MCHYTKIAWTRKAGTVNDFLNIPMFTHFIISIHRLAKDSSRSDKVVSKYLAVSFSELFNISFVIQIPELTRAFRLYRHCMGWRRTGAKVDRPSNIFLNSLKKLI